MTKVALVTGASRRVGASIVRRLHQDGMNIVIHFRGSLDAANNLCAELNRNRSLSAFTLQADLLDFDTLPLMIESVIDRFGRLDVLINNASSFEPSAIAAVDEHHWNRLFDTNLKAPFFLSQVAAPRLAASQGCIVNLLDIHGTRPLRGYPIYSVTKTALSGLTLALAKELAPDIRVNGIAPGAILWPDTEMDDEEKATVVDKIALKRIGEPVDIAAAVSYLCQHAPYVTGQILAVDGGRTLYS